MIQGSYEKEEHACMQHRNDKLKRKSTRMSREQDKCVRACVTNSEFWQGCMNEYKYIYRIYRLIVAPQIVAAF